MNPMIELTMSSIEQGKTNIVSDQGEIVAKRRAWDEPGRERWVWAALTQDAGSRPGNVHAFSAHHQHGQLCTAHALWF